MILTQKEDTKELEGTKHMFLICRGIEDGIKSLFRFFCVQGNV